ncbi:MAG: phosphatidylglycerophosphatase A [Alphaproteobacteria bacterium]|nr:phosphatidylglycerophosphatase A [Alphaproteobacteria bacterium]
MNDNASVVSENAATLFGIGRVGFAPGTVASLVALPIAWVTMRYFGQIGVFVLGLAVAALGMWASDTYAKDRGVYDPSECVIDELAGQLLACALAPFSLLGFAMAFLLFRLFDISKLWPISMFERLPGGLGIVGDDVVAGLIAGGIVAVVDTAGLI